MENLIRSKLSKEVADFYEKEGKMFSSKRTWGWQVMDLLKARLKPGDLLVDVGAGNGRLADILPEGVNYIGVEPSSTLRDEAQKNHKVEMRSGTLPKLDLPDNHAEAVACIAVLHHIPSNVWRVDSIKELHRILKPGGTLLCTVWNLRASRFRSWQSFKSAWMRLKGIRGGEAGDMYYAWKASGELEKRYVHAFTLGEFKSLFDPALWSIEKIGAYDRQGWCNWIKGRNLAALVTKK
ncbi:MAG: class I SAM-dependent methyltransferase [Patescibacteria group bacterium]|nr:class I SAM-dependent methyltransferase [Patescibacteria group bacterium]